MKYKILAVFFFILSGAHSQSEIRIELWDEKKSEPVSFASVVFGETSRGIIADYNGQFRLPFDKIENLPILNIKALGYLPVKLNASELNPKRINRVFLEESFEVLDEVVIESSRVKNERGSRALKAAKSMTAYTIAYNAVHGIKFNLDARPHSYVGYYRDYQISKNQYYNLNEGIFEQFDHGASTHIVTDSLNQTAIYSFKRNTDFAQNKALTKAYDKKTKFVKNASISSFGGNEFTILNIHNSIRNYNNKTFSFVYRMDLDFLKLHEFKKEDLFFDGDEPIIQISFTNIKNKTSHSHKVIGHLKISLLDFAIFDFDYTVYENNNLQNPIFNVRTAYRKQSGKMYLNYITFNNSFSVTDQVIFKESEIILNKKEKYFEISFNSNLDASTLKKRNFKIEFKGRKVYIKDVELVDARKVRLPISRFNEFIETVQKNDMSELVFKIKDLKDVRGRFIYRPSLVKAYQYREFFVQEVRINHDLRKDLNYMDKVNFLSQSKINSDVDSNSYIINSPLTTQSPEQ